jgi:hypothetical protein
MPLWLAACVCLLLARTHQLDSDVGRDAFEQCYRNGDAKRDGETSRQRLLRFPPGPPSEVVPEMFRQGSPAQQLGAYCQAKQDWLVQVFPQSNVQLEMLYSSRGAAPGGRARSIGQRPARGGWGPLA